MLRKMPYNYFVFKRLIKEIQMRVKSLQITPANSKVEDEETNKLSVLDYGAGLGSGMWAAMHCYGQENIFRVAAVEPNSNMRKLGKYLTEDLNKNGNILWVDSLAMIPGQGGERGKFDIVILGYVL
jgi:ribosomal protein RSM22 (predicted rRNA methylase)